jgi:hypothetical protein
MCPVQNVTYVSGRSFGEKNDASLLPGQRISHHKCRFAPERLNLVHTGYQLFIFRKPILKLELSFVSIALVSE